MAEESGAVEIPGFKLEREPGGRPLRVMGAAVYTSPDWKGPPMFVNGRLFAGLMPPDWCETVGDAPEADEAAEVVRSLRRGSCWCEMAIGNPMVRGHSSACLAAQKWLAERER